MARAGPRLCHPKTYDLSSTFAIFCGAQPRNCRGSRQRAWDYLNTIGFRGCAKTHQPRKSLLFMGFSCAPKTAKVELRDLISRRFMTGVLVCYLVLVVWFLADAGFKVLNEWHPQPFFCRTPGHEKCPLPLAGGWRGRYKVGAIGWWFVMWSGFRALPAGPVAREKLSILRLAGVCCV